MNQKSSNIRLIVSVTAGMLAFGFAPILVRLAPGVSPITLAAYRTVFAVLLLIPYWLYHQRKSGKKTKGRLTGKEQWLILLAGASLGLHFTLWIASLNYTTVASASVLVTMHPILLIIAESILMNRNFHKLTWAGVFIAFGGSAILGLADKFTGSSFPHPLFGDGLAVAAAFMFVIYFLLGRKLRQNAEWIDYVFRVYGYAALTCILFVLVTGSSTIPDRAGILVALGMAIGPQIIGHGSLNYGVKYISPTFLSTLVLIEPLLSTLLAWFFFKEIPPVLSFVGIGVTMAGIVMAWSKR